MRQTVSVSLLGLVALLVGAIAFGAIVGGGVRFYSVPKDLVVKHEVVVQGMGHSLSQDFPDGRRKDVPPPPQPPLGGETFSGCRPFLMPEFPPIPRLPDTLERDNTSREYVEQILSSMIGQLYSRLRADRRMMAEAYRRYKEECPEVGLEHFTRSPNNPFLMTRYFEQFGLID